MNLPFKFIQRSSAAVVAASGILSVSWFQVSLLAGVQNDPPNTGSSNLAVVTSGSNNTGLGFDALRNDKTGSYNTASGHEALPSNITGDFDTATGSGALNHNTDGDYNTATGVDSLFANTEGDANIATGYQSLYSNTVGNDNVADGYQALYSNIFGTDNVADGYQALYSSTNGDENVAIGYGALYSNKSGYNNTAIGQDAGSRITGNNNIDIGDAPLEGNPDDVAGESNTIRIGEVKTQTATFIAGINGVNVGSSAKYVVINANGRLGTAATTITSINPSKLNAALAKLEQRNTKLEATVAQQQKVFQTTIAQQQQQIQTLTASLKEQASLLQKVSAQIQVNRAAPQVVSN